jgi:D-arabinose 1-dehydrogenase-like Zn-dependent alcohol dehydrogenase
MSNQAVLVSGTAGSVGRSAVFAAKDCGAVVIAGVTKKQLEAARNLSADRVVALRRMRACRLLHVGCCDSSPSQHASKHFHATGHPVAASFEPGESWFYDVRTR